MTESISGTRLQRLSDFVAHHFGLHFPTERWPDLQRAVSAAVRDSGCECNLDRYVDELLSSTQRHAKALANYLTVGETYFFREPNGLEVLEKTLVPELIRKRENGAIRLWSAGCATGEEPYSIAIALSKINAGLENCSVEILGTDLNSKSLQKASEGTYGDWSFRGTPAWVRSAYFDATRKNRWSISPAIKEMVRFAQFNLMEDSLPPHSSAERSFDVIFCRNVLMYFTPEARRNVVQQLYRSLTSGGWLIVSPTETGHDLFTRFDATDFGGITLYRKSPPIPRKTCILPSVIYGANKLGSSLVGQRLENSESVPLPTSRTQKPPKDHATRLKNAEEQSIPHRPSQTLDELDCHEHVEQTVDPLASQVGNHAQAMFLIARAQADKGNLAAALVWCDKAIAADKMAPRAYYLRATILQEQGYLSDAAFALQQTVYVEPQFVLGHFCLGNLAWNQGRPTESEKHFENALLLLARYQPEDIVPESDGISAGRLGEMIISRRVKIPSSIPEANTAQREFRLDRKPHIAQTRIR